MYKRRLKIFLAIMGLAFAVILGRLVQLQVIQGEDHRRQYERLLQKTELLPASRGRVLDRQGQILAMDLPCYDLCLDYPLILGDSRWLRLQQRKIMREQKLDAQLAVQVLHRRVENAWNVARTAAAWTEVDLDDTVSRLIARIQAMRQARIARLGDEAGSEVREESQAHPIIQALDEEMATALQAQLEDTVGVYVRPSNRRYYPLASLACHIIGVTGQVSPEEQAMLNVAQALGAPVGDEEGDVYERSRRNYLGGDMIGKSGVERMCESTLRGQRGLRWLERGGREESVEPSLAGQDVRLTLDAGLQKELEAYLPAGYNGCIVVLSVPRGDVLAMVSLPTYDLNRYRLDYDKLAQDTRDFPLLHRAVGKRYPPGSTAKPVAAMGALASGIITTGSTVHCSGYLLEHDHNHFRCWIAKLYGQHGDLNIEEALKNSCNVFFYTMGNRLGTRRLGQYFELLGFGGPCGIGLGEEVSGRIPTDPHAGTARFMAIGQGEMEATPVHVANMMAAIGRGMYLPPRLVQDAPLAQGRRLGLNSGQLQAIQRGLYRVVNERGGTAYRIFHEGPDLVPLDVEICGKTGTAQTSPQLSVLPPPTRPERPVTRASDESDPDQDVDILDGEPPPAPASPTRTVIRSGDTAWFAGYAPYRNPQIAFAVVIEYVEKGGSGGRTAGPIARKVVAACKARGYIR